MSFELFNLADQIQINQLAEKEGIALSLIRPRRYKPNARSSNWKTKKGLGGKKEGMEVGQQHAAVENTTPNDPPPPRPPNPTADRVDALSSSKMGGKEESVADVDMDGLTAQLGDLDSSLQFKPRGVRKKAAAKALE